MKILRKLFGGIEMTWKRVIVSAVVIAAYTALMLLLPCTKNTSFRDIGGDIPCWILFAVMIIANCKTAKEASAKTFVFFLISQPLIYLFQVPFSALGWGLFGYYPPWFVYTLLTLPGAWIGWHVRKKGILSGVILTPMLFLLASCGCSYFRTTVHAFPYELLSGIFCFAVIVLFLAVLLTEKKQRITAVLLTALLTSADIFYECRTGASSVSFPLPETVSGTDITEVLVSDPDHVSVDTEELKEDHMDVAVRKPGEYEIRLIGADGQELALYDVNAFYLENGALKVECELKESE